MAVPVDGEGAAGDVEVIFPCQGHVPEEGEGGAGGSLCHLKGYGEVGEILFPRFCGKHRRRGIPAGAMAAAIQSVLWVGTYMEPHCCFLAVSRVIERIVRVFIIGIPRSQRIPQRSSSALYKVYTGEAAAL